VAGEAVTERRGIDVDRLRPVRGLRAVPHAS
jgi:hypothetical protein